MDLNQIVIGISAYFIKYGYPLVFFGVLVETTPLGGFIPGALLAAMGGFYSYDGPLSFPFVLILGTSGMFLTLISSYIIGKKTGMKLAHYFKQEENVAHAKVLLEKYGPLIVTTALLSNITRFWIAYIAGMQKYNIIQFSFLALVASLAWVSLLVISGYLAASSAHSIERNLAQVSIISWIFLAATGAVITWAIRKNINETRKELESE